MDQHQIHCNLVLMRDRVINVWDGTFFHNEVHAQKLLAIHSSSNRSIKDGPGQMK